MRWAPCLGPIRSCRRPCPTVSPHALAVSCAYTVVSQCYCLRPPVTIQKIVVRLNPYRAHCALCRASCRACRSVPEPCRRALLRCITALLRRIVTQKVRPSHDTKFVSRLTPNGQAMRARAAACPACRPAVSQGLLAVSWSCRDVLLAVSWPPCCAPSPAVSRYNLLYRDPAQNENG